MSEYTNIPPEYKPISMWGYFGYQILFSIPVIGFILLIILSFAPRNKNLKNFSRSYFCLFILGLIVTIVMIAIGFAVGAVDSINDLIPQALQ